MSAIAKGYISVLVEEIFDFVASIFLITFHAKLKSVIFSKFHGLGDFCDNDSEFNISNTL